MGSNLFILNVLEEVDNNLLTDVFAHTAYAHGMTKIVTQMEPYYLIVSKGSKLLNIVIGCPAPYYGCTMGFDRDTNGKLVVIRYDSMNICTGGGIIGVSRRTTHFKNFFDALYREYVRLGYLRQ